MQTITYSRTAHLSLSSPTQILNINPCTRRAALTTGYVTPCPGPSLASFRTSHGWWGLGARAAWTPGPGREGELMIAGATVETCGSAQARHHQGESTLHRKFLELNSAFVWILRYGSIKMNCTRYRGTDDDRKCDHGGHTIHVHVSANAQENILLCLKICKILLLISSFHDSR